MVKLEPGHGWYSADPLFQQRPGETVGSLLARGLEHLARRTGRWHPETPLLLAPSPAPSAPQLTYEESGFTATAIDHQQVPWLAKIVVRIVDLDHDRVELAVAADGPPVARAAWDVPAGDSFERTANEILAILPDPGPAPLLMLCATSGGNLGHINVDDLRDDWWMVWVTLMNEMIFGCFPALAAFLIALAVAAIAVPGALPGALLGIIGVPLGWALPPSFMLITGIVDRFLSVRSRARRLRSANALKAPPPAPSPRTTASEIKSLAFVVAFVVSTAGPPVVAVIAFTILLR